LPSPGKAMFVGTLARPKRPHVGVIAPVVARESFAARYLRHADYGSPRQFLTTTCTHNPADPARPALLDALLRAVVGCEIVVAPVGVALAGVVRETDGLDLPLDGGGALGHILFFHAGEIHEDLLTRFDRSGEDLARAGQPTAWLVAAGDV